MPMPGDLALEMAGVRARRRWFRCRHEPLALLDETRFTLGNQVVIHSLARCSCCDWLIERTQRYGKGSTGDSGWRTVR